MFARNTLARGLLVIAAIFSLGGCAPTLKDYAGTGPVFDPQSFFNGSLTSYGVFEDYRGKLSKQFTTRTTARWNGKTGTMKEILIFKDGDRKTREWAFTKVSDTHYTGTAPDVVGVAQGYVSGNSLHWVYHILLPVDGRDELVRFDDWLTMVDNRHVFSRVKISKWGLPVGQLTMFFEKN